MRSLLFTILMAVYAYGNVREHPRIRPLVLSSLWFWLLDIWY